MMMLHNKVCDLLLGGLFKVIVIDFLICCDIFKFCVFLGYELFGQVEEDGIYLYWICKKDILLFCGLKVGIGCKQLYYDCEEVISYLCCYGK